MTVGSNNKRLDKCGQKEWHKIISNDITCRVGKTVYGRSLWESSRTYSVAHNLHQVCVGHNLHDSSIKLYMVDNFGRIVGHNRFYAGHNLRDSRTNHLDLFSVGQFRPNSTT